MKLLEFWERKQGVLCKNLEITKNSFSDLEMPSHIGHNSSDFGFDTGFKH